MDSVTWIGYEYNRFDPAMFGPAVPAFTVAEHGAHEVFDPRLVPGYTQQLFGEMPPSFGFTPSGSTTTGSTYSVTSASDVPSTAAYDALQVFGERPQPYGFHNLLRQSVSLADGTEHSYYVLPENYFLEHATSSTSPAMATVEVSNNCQSLTPPMNALVAEKQTHHGQETLSILDMLAQVKAKLETISESYENMKQSCERISFGTKKKAAAVTNILSQDTCEQEQLPKEAGQTSTCFSKALENKTHSPKSAVAIDRVQFQISERQPVYVVYDDESDSRSPKSAVAIDRVQFQISERQPVYVVYDDESDSRSNESVHVFASPPEQQPYEEKLQESGQLPKCFSKLTYCVEKPTDDTFFSSVQKYDTEVLAVCLKNASDIAVSVVATDFSFPFDPVIHADRSVKLTNEKSTQATSIVCVPKAILHCRDERPEHINCTNRPETVQLNPLSLTKPWDPSVLFMHSGITDNSARTTSSADWLTFSSPTSCELPHSASIKWSTKTAYIDSDKQRTYMHLVALLSCPLPSFEMDKLQWDPGIGISSSIYLWLQGLAASIATVKPLFGLQISELAIWRSQVTTSSYVWDPGTCSNVLQTVFASAVKCFNAFELGWTELNATAALVLLVPCSEAKTVQVTEHRHHLEFSFMHEMSLNVSEFGDGQLAYMPHRTILIQYKSILLVLFTEEKKLVTLVTEQWIFWLNATYCRQIFQKCKAMSSLFSWHKHIEFNEIAIWLITFNPP